jgi:hypothetical protein
MKTILFGIAVTIALGLYMNAGSDWSAGADQTPRQYIADYLDTAYTQGLGKQAAERYFLPTTVDHHADSPDRFDGPPIKHQVKLIIADGMTVAVHHHIDAARGQPAQEVVDIYKTSRIGRIIERTRISQIDAGHTP